MQRMTTQSLTQLSPQQLRRAAEIKEKIDSLQKELGSLLGISSSVPANGATKGKRTMSAAGRARIAAAARARWARQKAQANSAAKSSSAPAKSSTSKRRQISPEARARMAEGAKARWAKMRASGSKAS